MALETYLSSRHRQETWVKGGYLQVDRSPIDHPLLHSLMEVVTIKAGMFPLNYGDAHFRRSDNGQVMHNPFVGNLILDAWTFEPGAEVYLRRGGFMAMGAVTSGSNKGDVTVPENRGPAFYGKLGVDRQISEQLRVRLTGSYYRADKTPTLYFGDRAGSRYYMVLEEHGGHDQRAVHLGADQPGLQQPRACVPGQPLRAVRRPGAVRGDRAGGGAHGGGGGAPHGEAGSSGDVIYRLLDDRLYTWARAATRWTARSRSQAGPSTWGSTARRWRRGGT